MYSSFTRPIQNLLLLAIACTPLFALREFLKFSGLSVPTYVVYVSFLKDILLAIVFCLCVVQLFVSKKYPWQVFPFLVFFSLFTLLVAALSYYDPLMVLAGFRWSLPILLIVWLCGHIDGAFLRRLVPVVGGLLVLNTLIQVYQLITHQFRWGNSLYSTIFGRVCGFFELPSIAGFNACIYFFIIRYFFTGPRWAKNSLLGIAIVSTFLLSISTTGFVLMLLMLVFPFIYRESKYRGTYILSAVVFGMLVYNWLDTLNGRYPGDTGISWHIRVALLQNEWQHAQVISSHFGQASNAVAIIKSFLGKPVTNVMGGGESFYPPLMGNYGMLFFCACLLLLLLLFIKILRTRNEAMTLFFFVAILGAATVRITETFPLGILISILSAYFIGGQSTATTKNHLKGAEIAGVTNGTNRVK